MEYLDDLYALRDGFFASLKSAADAAPNSDEPTVAVPVWMIVQAINQLNEVITKIRGHD